MTEFTTEEALALQANIRKAANACPGHYRVVKSTLELMDTELWFYAHQGTLPRFYTLSGLFESARIVPCPVTAPEKFQSWLTCQPCLLS